MPSLIGWVHTQNNPCNGIQVYDIYRHKCSGFSKDHIRTIYSERYHTMMAYLDLPLFLTSWVGLRQHSVLIAKCYVIALGKGLKAYRHPCYVDNMTPHKPICINTIHKGIWCAGQKFLSWWHHQMETFPRNWPFVRGIHWSQVNSPHKGQWPGALIIFWSASE